MEHMISQVMVTVPVPERMKLFDEIYILKLLLCMKYIFGWQVEKSLNGVACNVDFPFKLICLNLEMSMFIFGFRVPSGSIHVRVNR